MTELQTQRAYTLRLKGIDEKDQSWRDALWKTHEAVNKGAKVFGDWLLTLRGGLDHTLADAEIPGEKGKPDRAPTQEERKHRRILLALSWLSVESERGAPEEFIVATGKEPAATRNDKVIAALKDILRGRNLTEEKISEWTEVCTPSLSAAIREDAVWVNRSRAFDEAVKRIGSSLTREEVWDMLECFFGSRNAYLAPVKISEDESSDGEQEEKAKDLVQKAGQWLSSRFGTGEGADFAKMAAVYAKIAAWAGNAQAGTTGNEVINNLATALREFTPKSNDLKGVLDLISGPGYKSATRNLLKQIANTKTVTREDISKLQETAGEDSEECATKTGSKGKRAYADAILKDVESVCGFTYRIDKDGQPVSVADYSKYDEDYKWGSSRHKEFAVMLDHAARRVSLAHTWIKRAEAERRKFEEDSKKIMQVPQAAKDWLDAYCAQRSEASGALEPYRIRKRAIQGWKEIIASWNKPDCKTAEDRIAAARQLQDDPEIEKFGDIQLFEALAEDDAQCVWKKEDGTLDPEILINYTLASEAMFKKQHFKVPSYRHPDAFLYPVFCDFGNSRWELDFSIREAATKLKEIEAKIEKQRQEVHKVQQALEKCENDEKRPKMEERLKEAQKKLQESQNYGEYLHSNNKITMVLFDGTFVKKHIFAWQSKRLTKDLALYQEPSADPKNVVSRADRLGRAVASVGINDAVKVAGLFEQENWNGRLQAPRQQLEAIAQYVEKHGWDNKAEKMRASIKWFITFSAKLQSKGPWNEFARKHGLKEDPHYWPHAEKNENRTAHSRLILSRLPGLRVLSVDLGHRYAAACAVWEALGSEAFKKDIEGKRIIRGDTDENALYCHTEHEANGKKHITIYRRIGADTLPDGAHHPAPWARLDRQFLIKLQGEDEQAREASNEEIWKVHQLENTLGRRTPLIDRLIAGGWGYTEKQKARLEVLTNLGWCPTNKTDNQEEGDEEETAILSKPSLLVDDLMFSAVRTLRLALKRHGDRARIAHYLITDEKTKPGGVKEKLDKNGRVELLLDALGLWHDLFSSPGWHDEKAKQLWNAYIAGLLPEGELQQAKSVTTSAALGGQQKKEKKEKLRAVAEALYLNSDLCHSLNEVWRKRWEEDDKQWRIYIRWFKDWIMPRGANAKSPAIRHVGGLSLTRLATLTEFRRKVQVGFFTRLHPDGTKTETREDFGQKTLDTLEHLREQRVKQLASRIVEAALGIGSEDKRHWDGKKRPRQRIADPRFVPCHAVVIENLTHYRPEETRTRRENRQIMEWASSKVKKYLSEICQLHGLHLREVSAAYTSHQDSRTGAPGIRCQDVSLIEFMKSPFWRKQVAQAEKKQKEGKGDAVERYLCELNQKWKGASEEEWRKAGFVRIPLRGGEIFVSAAGHDSPAAKGIHADLNAAANIGLRALLDPDWSGKWWYVPCNSSTMCPARDKVTGSAAVNPGQPLQVSAQLESDDAAKDTKKRKKKGDGKSKEIINLWRDISSYPLEDTRGGTWSNKTVYWNRVQSNVVHILQNQMKG